MSIQTIFNSHNTWFDLLSYTKLNELFQRASWDPVKYRVLLQQHINSQLPTDSKYYTTIRLEQTFTRKNTGIRLNICSIYINIHDTYTQQQVAHFTLHFFKHKELKKESTGRIHFQNKTQRSHVIHINKNANDKINMVITSYPNIPPESLKQIYSIIINIITLYTTHGTPIFLGIPLTSMSIDSIEHPCINLTEKEWKTSKTPLRHTRKANYSSLKHIRRNKKTLP